MEKAIKEAIKVLADSRPDLARELLAEVTAWSADVLYKDATTHLDFAADHLSAAAKKAKKEDIYNAFDYISLAFKQIAAAVNRQGQHAPGAVGLEWEGWSFKWVDILQNLMTPLDRAGAASRDLEETENPLMGKMLTEASALIKLAERYAKKDDLSSVGKTVGAALGRIAKAIENEWEVRRTPIPGTLKRLSKDIKRWRATPLR